MAARPSQLNAFLVRLFWKSLSIDGLKPTTAFHWLGKLVFNSKSQPMRSTAPGRFVGGMPCGLDGPSYKRRSYCCVKEKMTGAGASGVTYFQARSNVCSPKCPQPLFVDEKG